MRTKVRNWLLSLLKVGLAAGIIIYIFKTRVDLRELLSQVRAMDRGGLIFCWCAYGALFLLSARRWQILARVQGIAARYAELIEYCFIGLFFNNILLGSMGGDVLKAYYLARAVPARREGAVISVVADRSVGFLSFFVIGLVGLLLNRGDARLRGPIAIFFAFFACALLFLLLLYSRALIKKIPFLRRLVGRLPFEATILRLYESFYSYRSRPRAVAGALGISCAMQLVGNAIILAIARMLGIREVGYSHLLLLMPLIGTIFAIPVTPSGWGTGELAFCAFLGALGVPYTRAIALDFVMRAMVISWSLLGGALYAMPCWRVSSDEIAEEKALHVV